MKKVLFFIAEDRYFYSHRFNLAKAAIKMGYRVAIATRCSKYKDKIIDAGIEVFPLKNFKRSDLNPIAQILALMELNKIYRTFKPDIVHHVALKPVILGSFLAWWCKTPKVINALGGLGILFSPNTRKFSSGASLFNLGSIKKRILLSLIFPLLRFIFARENTCLILQNNDDVKILVQNRCIKENKIKLIRGAGVDIHAFKESNPPASPPWIITCATRMLWEKGVGILVEATKILKAKNIPIEVVLLGEPDPENPESIPESILRDWHEKKIIRWAGHCENVADYYQKCHIAVLPSYYREGLPKSLLEAASCSRPIVTTDFPGCREVVKAGENGLLIPIKDPNALADALLYLIENEPLRIQMGKMSRKLVEAEFAEDLIHAQTLALYS